jgi:hypothetical protein
LENGSVLKRDLSLDPHCTLGWGVPKDLTLPVSVSGCAVVVRLCPGGKTITAQPEFPKFIPCENQFSQGKTKDRQPY